MRRFRRVLRLRRRGLHRVANRAVRSNQAEAASRIQEAVIIVRTPEDRSREIRRYSRCGRIRETGIIVRNREDRIRVNRRYNLFVRTQVAEIARILRGRTRGLQFVLRTGLGVRRRGAVRLRAARLMDGDQTIARGCTATMREACSRSICRTVRCLASADSSPMRTFHTSRQYRLRCTPICRHRLRAMRWGTTTGMWWCMTR